MKTAPSRTRTARPGQRRSHFRKTPLDNHDLNASDKAVVIGSPATLSKIRWAAGALAKIQQGGRGIRGLLRAKLAPMPA